MKASKQLLTIYVEEMRNRVHLLGNSLDNCQSAVESVRRDALYEARLQAHTMKGASAQLDFEDAAELAGAMSRTLEQAADDQVLSQHARLHIERGCSAIEQWLDAGIETESDQLRGLAMLYRSQ